MPCELILTEYELLYSTYESFNNQSITLKSWSVTVGLAGIIAAFSEKITSHRRVAVIVASLSAIPFWITDAFWKSYQNANLDRLIEIEKLQSCEVSEFVSPKIVGSWKDAYGSFDWLMLLPLPSVALPHVFTLLIGLFLAWRFKFRASKETSHAET